MTVGVNVIDTPSELAVTVRSLKVVVSPLIVTMLGVAVRYDVLSTISTFGDTPWVADAEGVIGAVNSFESGEQNAIQLRARIQIEFCTESIFLCSR